jgi:cysteine desulfurase/selenocysteine lyase
MSAMDIAASLAEVRASEFPIVAQYTYLDCASEGPLPNRTVATIRGVAEAAQAPHLPQSKELPNYEQLARTRLARLIGADADDIVFTSNTTHGMNIAAQGIAYRLGDNIVVPEPEFPSLMFTFAHLAKRDVEVRFVAYEGAGPSIEAIMARVDDRTRVVACSGIMWNTGYRHDLEELGAACARRGCLLLVDGVQVIGARAIDVKAAKISTLATHGYKWLLSGFGIAALYVSPDALDQISPVFVGKQSFAQRSDTFDGRLDYQVDARRFVEGNLNKIGLAALATSLGLIEEIGIAAIEERGRLLAQRLFDGLQRKESVKIISSSDPHYRSAVTVFTLGSRDRDAVIVQQLEEQGIMIALRPRGLRVSPHFYNTEAEVDRLLGALPD